MLPVDLLIKGGKVVSGDRTVDRQWIAVKDGRIVATGIGDVPEAKKTIDATGKYVLPGVVDPETHPAQPVTELISSESMAAIASGTTTMGMQATSNRIVKNPPEIRKSEDMPSFLSAIPEFIDMVKNKIYYDYFMIPNINNDWMVKEIPDMAYKLGASSYKFYTHLKAGEHLWHLWGGLGQKRGDFYYDDGTIFEAMRHVAKLGPPSKLVMHCENFEIVRLFREEMIQQGRKDIEAWEDESPDFLEAGYLRTYAYYARMAGCPIYLIHTTTRKTIEEVRKARAEGTTIIANVQPHYALFERNMGIINVPLRKAEDREAIWEAIKSDDINCIASDTLWQIIRPLEHVEKYGVVPPPGDPFNWQKCCISAAGFNILPVMLSEGVNKGRITIERLVKICSENTAKAFGLYPKKGSITPGADADFAIVDLNRTKKVTRDMIFSKWGWSSWEGWELKGWPVMTILRGNVIMEWPEGEPNRKIVGERIGEYIPIYPGNSNYPIS